MWLLNTKRAELKEFVSPEKAPPYAILSHTWSQDETKPEQTFQEVRAICKLYPESSGKNPRDFLCEKVRRCCEFAEADGYEWVWIDTCCIDKSSSAELSEAINSMFRYYARSRVCYVYLENWDGEESSLGARSPGDLDRKPGRVARPLVNRWFRRGWTLQELIAPDFVLFLDSEWIPRGSKLDFAETIEEITDIPSELLSLSSSLADYNVAERMSWAANRKTKREEDEAYCLLGIFGIHLTTLYGEGRRAFHRLQEELLRQDPDPTLFCCGTHFSLDRDRWTTGWGLPPHRHWVGGYLLVDRPWAFQVPTKSAKIVHVIPECVGQLGHGARPFAFNLTPYGIEVCVPLYHTDLVTLADLGYRRHDGMALYLPLLPDRRNSGELSSRPLYHVALMRPLADSRMVRVLIGRRQNDAQIEWGSPKNVLIAFKPPLLASGLNPKSALKFAHSTRSPFRFDPVELIAKRPDRRRITIVDKQDHSVPVPTCFVSVWEPHISGTWSYQDKVSNEGWGVARIELAAEPGRVLARRTLNFVIQLGLCAAHHDVTRAPSKSNVIVHWARVEEVTHYKTRLNDDGIDMHWHNCDEDHISAWGSLSKTFKFPVSHTPQTETDELLLVTLRFKILAPIQHTIPSYTQAYQPVILWMEPPDCVDPGSTRLPTPIQS